MDTEDGGAFIKHLAYYIRTHEKALANSLYSRRQANRRTSSEGSGSSAASIQNVTAQAQVGSGPNALLSILSLNRGAAKPRAPKLFLSPNQLYYLLTRFEELEVKNGPLNVRLENIHADSANSNYVSFMSHEQAPKIRSSDADSMHSVSSVRSVVSSVSGMFSSLNFTGKSTAKIEKQRTAAREDLRHVYSCFTKIPCVKLSIDERIRRISGFEVFPFDTAVPMHVFKNLTHFELSDIDFRSVFGWDQLAEQLRSLVINRASLDDMELLTTVVLDDVDGRRRRSTKSTCSTPLALHGTNPFHQSEDFFSSVSPDGAKLEGRPKSSPKHAGGTPSEALQRPRVRTDSAHRHSPTRKDSTRCTSFQRLPKRRTSSSSSSHPPPITPRARSSSNLLLSTILSPTKWRFLRHLSVADNGLTSIRQESLKPFSKTLVSLDISSNLFSEIPDALAMLENLTSLNVSNCMIDSLRSLARAPLLSVTAFSLRTNRITSMAGIEAMKALQRLDIRANSITDPTELARLTGMASLQDILIKENPFTRTHANHRVTIFNVFRSTPGSSTDILINSTGPGYAERQQLVDRVSEHLQRSRVQDSYEDEGDVMLLDRKLTNARTSGEGSRRDDTRPGTLVDGYSNPHLRRKLPKRRLVDLSDSVMPHTRDSATSTRSDAAYMTAKERPDDETSKKLRLSKAPSDLATTNTYAAKTAIEVQSPEDLTRSAKQSETAGPSNDLYRRRLDALKVKSGKAWLSPLNTGQSEPTTAYSAFNSVRDRAIPTAERA